MRVACVDRRGSFGGTCLNIGCIPSKALLQSSELFAEARDGLDAYGIRVPTVELDLGAMMERKNKVVKELTQGVEFLFRKNKVDCDQGHRAPRRPGPGAGRAQCRRRAGARAPGTIVIATGSEITPLPGVQIDEQRIVSSTGALELERGADAPGGDRRRLHRARARLGVAPARRQGHRGRVPRPDHARHGPRGVAPVPAPAVAPGAGLQARHQGHRGRRQRRPPAGHDRSGRRRRGREDEGGRGAGRGRPAALHRGPRPRDASTSTADDHGRIEVDDASPPTSPASMRSAT